MKKLAFLLATALPLLATNTVAEDIELYLGNTAFTDQDRPKVLFIFDTSGSMADPVDVRARYDKNTTYDALSGSDTRGKNYIYYVKGAVDGKPIPGVDLRGFKRGINSCNTARTKLDDVGYYIGYVREYQFAGESGSWQELPELDGSTINMVDCLDDVTLSDPTNYKVLNDDGSTSNLNQPGYPVDGRGNTSEPDYYADKPEESNTGLGAGEIVTMYTANYLRWALGDIENEKIGEESRDKIDIAKEAVTALVEAAPTVDFALKVFNGNWGNSDNGGRVVYGFKDNFSATERQAYVDKVDDLIASGATPLCESLYEAYRYLAGETVYYGDDDPTRQPTRDTGSNVETGGRYVSPYTTCSNEINIILMTDGIPYLDTHINTTVANMTGEGASDYHDSYLTALARWMHDEDLDPNREGDQIANIYTLGFSLGNAEAVNLLQEAALAGGGEYINAEEPSDLLSELQQAIVNILQRDSTFTAPSVASNNFDRTETLDSVYYAMFTPDKGPRWQGNLKKLKIRSGGLEDRHDQSAIDDNGNIKITATTYWSSANSGDGATVGEGGVVEMFSGMTPGSRTIYSDTGNQGALEELTKDNASDAFTNDAGLATFMGIPESDIDEYLSWAIGQDVDDEDGDNSTTDMREDVFGDPLHSKPLVLNYGTSETDQDVRIIIGTNAGALHMFSDNVDQSSSNNDVVTESWAFMPKEFFKNIRTLRDNFTSSDKVYGIDGTPVSYIIDYDDNGRIDHANDKVYIYFGLRRGGSSYYGMDLTDPDDPKLLWHKDSTDTGFSQIKQSWSTPRIGFSRINMAGDTPKPVLVFSAGYDPQKDDQAASSSVDTNGRGFYMLDAKSGDLLWSMTPSTTPAFPGTDSIPSPVAPLDADADGYFDRLYAGDTGGNVWRIDMPGTDTSKWKASQLASLGGGTTATDRRFFAEPTIARALITETYQKEEIIDGVSKTNTYKVEKPYDAILIGSGDRTNPLDTATNDMLFMIKDENILTKTFEDGKEPDVIEFNDLYDFTTDVFYGKEKDSDEYNALAAAVSQKKGWRIDLAQSEGEKNVAKPEAIAGVAYYSTYAPPDSSSNDCSITEAGSGYLYAIDLSLGIQIYDKRILETSSALTDGITMVTIPEEEDEDDTDKPTNKVDGNPLAILAGEALTLCNADGNCDGIRLKTMRNSLAIQENQ